MLWGGRWEGGSCLGTHVRIKDIKIKKKKRIHLPMQETWVGSLGQKDSLEKEMESHSSVLAWDTPWTDTGGL